MSLHNAPMLACTHPHTRARAHTHARARAVCTHHGDASSITCPLIRIPAADSNHSSSGISFAMSPFAASPDACSQADLQTDCATHCFVQQPGHGHQDLGSPFTLIQLRDACAQMSSLLIIVPVWATYLCNTLVNAAYVCAFVCVCWCVYVHTYVRVCARLCVRLSVRPQRRTHARTSILLFRPPVRPSVRPC